MLKRKAVPHVIKRTSKHLIMSVASDLDCSYAEAKRIVDIIGEVCASALKRDDYICMNGIGTLRTYIEKSFANPIPANRFHPYEEVVWTKPRRCIRFTPYDYLVKLVNEDYKGLDTLEELYATNESRPTKARSL